MARVHLIHWDRDEAETRLKTLASAGHEVTLQTSQAAGQTRALRADPPDVAVIDLSRKPSHGREMAQWFRDTKAVRGVAVVFVGGAEEKIARAQRDFPAAVFATWRGIRGAVRKAARGAGRAPGAPRPRPASPGGYSGTPLPRKLGIKAGHTVALLRAPKNFDAALGGLPDDVRVKRQARGSANVVVLFCTKAGELPQRFARAEQILADGGGLWVAWPKKASGVRTDVSDAVVRAVGLDAGLVDNKVCAIDETWSGLRFMRRRR